MMYIKVTNAGNISNSDIDSIKIYNEDETTVGSYEGTETLIATLSNIAGTTSWSADDLSVNSGTKIIVVVSLSDSVSSGETFRAAIPFKGTLVYSNVWNSLPILNANKITVE